VRATGVTIEDALAMASTQPAAYLGIAPRGTMELEWDAASSRLAVLQVHV